MPYSKDCPYCGETLRLNEGMHTACCDACGSEFAPEELFVQSEQDLLRLLNDSPKEKTDCCGFLCEHCGAQLIAEEAAAFTFCGYCGAPAIVPTVFHDAFEPELVLPFAIDRREALYRFAQWFDRKKLAPPAFLETVKAGKISGFYVPFWLFDCEMQTHLHAISSTTETLRTEKRENVTAKEVFRYRAVNTVYTGVPADASEKLDGRLMNLLGPFDLTRLEPFEPSHLEGVYVEMHSLTAEQVFGRVREQLEADSLRAARETLAEQSFAKTSAVHHRCKAIRVRHALLPVWIVNCRDNGFTHQFFMNGQTGKIVGEAPLSMNRALQWFGGVAAATAAAGELLWFLIDKFLA